MSSPISRRTALRSLASAAALASVTRSRAAEEKAAAPKLGGDSFKHSVCKWCYPKIALEDLAKAAKGLGLSSIELLQPADFPLLKKYDLACAMVSNPTGKTPQGVSVGGIPKAWNRVEHHDTLVELYTKQIAAVADGGMNNLICFSGNRDKMDDQQGLENCAVGLKRIMAVAEKAKVTITMELLNSKVNHKDYMCDHTAWGVELCKRVGSERFKLLYDIYHMQIMEGDVIATIKSSHSYISHYHTGGVPGRKEIDETQELYYPAIAAAIKATGYRGYLGQEFIPARDPLTSLGAAVKLCMV
ncbi:MAG: TIM barrel protein [Verrucomicrobia bacterium]|nr:TIM barrel protein [Verrucomicrobiota bacterium]